MLTLLHLLSAVALLVWGTHIVRTGVMRVFGARLRTVLSRSVEKKPLAFCAGIGVTALVQSSNATTMLVTSFVAQDLVALAPALVIVLGADVGTALMARILTFDLSWLSPLLIFIGVIFFLGRKQSRAGQLGRVGIGLGLILLALELIVQAVMQLLQNGHDVIILDNLCNSKRSVLPVIERLGGKHPTFVEGDIRNEALMTEILHDHAIDTVIHFAGLKAVGESVQKPLEYYDNNVNGTLRLISAMRAANVKNFIFSSSATVYGDQPKIPYVESFPTGTPQSPYGKSKLMVEQILTDLQKAQPDWSIALLRYFNPVGAHPSGDMGEDPQGIPNNLMPYIAQVAVGRRDSLAIFGNDYPTEDGTGVRDYIHVMDLADGHVVAMEKLANKPGVHIYNLGAGVGNSVLDVVNAFSKACGKPVNYHFAPRREGDLPAYWADASKADRELNWRVTRTLDEMAQDTWHWQSRHPQGYPD